MQVESARYSFGQARLQSPAFTKFADLSNVSRNCNTNAGSIVDRPLLNTKWMLPNATIVLSMWFIIRSNSFTVWDISFILQKLLHSSMIPDVSSLNLHDMLWQMLALHPFPSLDIQSHVLSSFFILQ